MKSAWVYGPGIARRRAVPEPVQVALEPGQGLTSDHGDPRVADAEVGCHFRARKHRSRDRDCSPLVVRLVIVRSD